VVTLARAVARIGRKRLPVHVTPPARAYLKGLAQALSGAGRAAMTMLQDERTAGTVLDVVLRKPEIRRPLVAALTNTATPTVLRAGDKVNVIPSRAEALIDGRTLPGQGPGDLVRELKKLAPELDFEVISAEASAEASHETELFDAIRSALVRHQPDATVVPMLMPGMTDAKSWSRLGTKCYGFIPLPLPDDFPRAFELIHGHDERVPVDALCRGALVFHEVVNELFGPAAPANP
jgi:acetylornithine deacetylase/succinyl-diaminopimelate desuccinylase-like protein